MTNYRSNIGSSSTRRRVATLIAVIGFAFVGSRLASVWPRNVEIAYDVGSMVEELDVDYRQAGDLVASVRFDQPAQKVAIFRHVVRLRPGEYQIHITLYGRDRSATEERRRLSVPATGVTRFELRGATKRAD
jgi:hypothetical protein